MSEGAKEANKCVHIKGGSPHLLSCSAQINGCRCLLVTPKKNTKRNYKRAEQDGGICSLSEDNLPADNNREQTNKLSLVPANLIPSEAPRPGSAGGGEPLPITSLIDFTTTDGRSTGALFASLPPRNIYQAHRHSCGKK